MGNNCCVRDKGNIETQNSSSMNHQQPNNRLSLQQFQIIEKLSHFNPRKNALPVALTHFLQEGCQGLMRSLPRLIEISEIYAKKGDQSHYFDPLYMQSQFNLTECVSPGKQFFLDDLSSAFELELKYFEQNGIIKEKSQSWGVILIMKIAKQTHSFTIKKRNGWEYVIHTLYEVTDEEMKEEQEQLRKQQALQKDKQINRLHRLQTDQKYNKETEENIQKLNYLLYSEESTQQDEILTPNQDIITPNNEIITPNKEIITPNQDDAFQNHQQSPAQSGDSTQNSSFQNSNGKSQPQSKKNSDSKQDKQSFINPVKRYSELPRQSTRATFRQANNLRLRDMVFKGYNCGEICFSPYEVFLEYLNSITEEYQQSCTHKQEQNPQVNSERSQGFMQLITFKREFNLDLNSNRDLEHDYTNLLSPEK